MSEASSPFCYSEARFAAEIGLSRADAKFLRDQKLTKHEHWQRRNGDGEIALSLKGVKKVWRQLEKKPLTLDLATCEFKNGSCQKVIALGAPRTVRVTQIPVNPYILKARDVLGQDYVIRRGGGHFAVGLELLVERDSVAGLWRIVGPVPRFPGDRAYKPFPSSEKK